MWDRADGVWDRAVEGTEVADGPERERWSGKERSRDRSVELRPADETRRQKRATDLASFLFLLFGVDPGLDDFEHALAVDHERARVDVLPLRKQDQELVLELTRDRVSSAGGKSPSRTVRSRPVTHFWLELLDALSRSFLLEHLARSAPARQPRRVLGRLEQITLLGVDRPPLCDHLENLAL